MKRELIAQIITELGRGIWVEKISGGGTDVGVLTIIKLQSKESIFTGLDRDALEDLKAALNKL